MTRRTGSRRSAGELETKILVALWRADAGLTVQEVLDDLDGELAYTTVAKVLDRLHEKGTVTKTAAGRSFVYEPVADETAFVSTRVRTLLDRSGNRTAAIQGLVDALDPGDTARLVQLLADARGSLPTSPETSA